MATTKIEASNIATGAVPSTGFNSVQTFTSSATWTRPTDITKVIVEVQAGGAGGVSGNGVNVGSGSGGGAYAKQYIDVSSISTSPIIVGAAGAAGVVGGTSSWIDGTNTISCAGGAIGSVTTGGAGGAATATGAQIKINGQNGEPGAQSQGGSSGLGIGGGNLTQDTGNTTGHVGTGYGGGGSSGRGVSSTGGAGSVGIVIVWEYK